MAKGLNKVMLIGNLGRDPEMRYTASGLAVANFSVATTERYKDEDRTEWHRIVIFGKLAEIAGQYLTKGARVYLEGRLQTRDWEDRDQNKRTTTEIVVNDMVMLSSRDSQGPNSGYRPQPPQQQQSSSGMRENASGPAYGPADDDDIPF